MFASQTVDSPPLQKVPGSSSPCAMKACGDEMEGAVRAGGRAGYKGIEDCSVSLVEKGIEELTPRKRQAMVAAIERVRGRVVGLHWLLPPPAGLHVTTPEGSCGREAGTISISSSTSAATSAEKSWSSALPGAKRGERSSPIADATKYLAEGLARAACPCPRVGESKCCWSLCGSGQTNVVNTTAERSGSWIRITPQSRPCIAFHNTTDEDLPFHEIIEKYFPRIGHVHVQEMDGKRLGAGTGTRDCEGLPGSERPRL